MEFWTACIAIQLLAISLTLSGILILMEKRNKLLEKKFSEKEGS